MSGWMVIQGAYLWEVRINKRLHLLTGEGVCCKKPGETYFRTCGTIIGSKSLTTVFGMGTGVTFSI